MQVLLADDSKANRLLVGSYVEEAGHNVTAVEDGEKVIKAYEDNRPDLIILDVSMPVMDGIETARELRKLAGSENDWVPIVFLSGMSDSDDIARGIDAGGDDYLTKPVNSTVLAAKLRAMQRIVEMRQQLHKANIDLKLLSVKDGLTGLTNRGHFDKLIIQEFKRCNRTKTPLSIIMCDVDYFKAYNDNYGHQLGDDCLRAVSTAMQSVLKRPGDIVARYGGEEFAVILPETDLVGSQKMAECLRQTVSALALKHKTSPIADHVSLSLGVATISPKLLNDREEAIYNLIKIADQRLYEAKSKGRNQVVSS